jgi:hypothetical protein
MNKNEILENIKKAQFIKGRNSMGVSESFYNPYFLIKECFEFEDLEKMTEEEINRIYNFADKVTDIFY